MKKCIISDKVKGGKKIWLDRYNPRFPSNGTTEKRRSDVGADSPDQDQVSAAIRKREPDISQEENKTEMPRKRNQSRNTKENSSGRNSPRESGNKIDKKVAIRRSKGVSAMDPRYPKITLAILTINLNNKFDYDLTENMSVKSMVINNLISSKVLPNLVMWVIHTLTNVLQKILLCLI
jgi:hypothetical protein